MSRPEMSFSSAPRGLEKSGFRRLAVGDVPGRKRAVPRWGRPMRIAAATPERVPPGLGAGRRLKRPTRGVKKTVLAKEAADPVGIIDEAPSSTTQNNEVKLIVTDVDGTLLNSKQELTLRVEASLARAAAAGVPTVLATGKSRGPWADKVLKKLAGAPMPGVFVQGCVTCDVDGTVIESIELNSIVAQSVIRFAEGAGVNMILFCGSRILCSERNADTDKVLAYGEPVPEPVGNLTENVVDKQIGINKILLFAKEKDMPALRTDAELMFENDCAITTAVPGMLEFLPPGVSKGAAVEKLLKRLGVDPTSVLALGDGENDAEMLRLAGTAVAMKGSSKKVIVAAGGVVGGSNDSDGVADAVEKYVLEARGLQPASEIKMPRDDDTSKTEIKTASIAAAVAAAEEKAISAKERKSLAAKENAITQQKKKRTVEMEKAKAVNSELLEASKAATKRLAELRGSLLETEAALVEAEEEARLKTGSISEKAKKVAIDKAEKFAQVKALEKKAAEAEARAKAGGWGDKPLATEENETSAADTWVTAAESEQRDAVAAASDAAEARAQAAVADFEAAKAADAANNAVETEILDDEDAPVSGSVKSATTTSTSSSQMPSFASIGGFFAAALQTVSRLASPEARTKQAAAERASAKASLLATLVSTNIGRDCDAVQLSAVLEQALLLEALNPTKTPVKSTLLRGRWSAVFTNSRQLLGMDKKITLTRQSGPVYAAFDVDGLRSEWQYTWPVKVERANLSRDKNSGGNSVNTLGNTLKMSFEQTLIFGLFSAPGSKKPKEYGSLEITYLDLDMMLARGQNQTIYVFVQTNSNYRIGDLDSSDVNRRLN